MTARVLDPAEWQRMIDLKDSDYRSMEFPQLVPYLRPEDASICVVEDRGEIVASLGVLRVPYLEGLWISRDHRHATKALIDLAFPIARSMGSGWAFGGAHNDQVRKLFERLGGVRLPFDPYALSV